MFPNIKNNYNNTKNKSIFNSSLDENSGKKYY